MAGALQPELVEIRNWDIMFVHTNSQKREMVAARGTLRLSQFCVLCTDPLIRPQARPPHTSLNRILSWTFSRAVFDASGVSSAFDLINELAVSLPAVRNPLPGLLAPGTEIAAVDH